MPKLRMEDFKRITGQEKIKKNEIPKKLSNERQRIMVKEFQREDWIKLIDEQKSGLIEQHQQVCENYNDCELRSIMNLTKIDYNDILECEFITTWVHLEN